MTTPHIFTPSSIHHKRLRRIADGGENTTVNPATLGSLYQDDDLKGLAWDYFNMEKQGRRNFTEYMDLEEPAEVVDGFEVCKFLTEQGKKALAALDMGWFWDSETHAEAIQETFDFYRNMMKSGRFTAQHADWIVGNTDERFKELRNEVIYFKLKANRVGDVFVEAKDG